MARLLSSAAAFSLVEGGHVILDTSSKRCQEAGYDVITSLSECGKAAKELKLSHTIPVVTAINYWASTPYGCYFQDSGLLTKGLWFNPHSSSSSDGTPHNDRSLCVEAEPGHFPTKSGLHVIESWDGTKLTADSEVPVGFDDTKFPLIVFMNSWDVPQIEYLVKTIEWAKLGYVCVEYQARGWFLSGGEIGTAGPDDIKDVSAVIDWALAKFPQADPSAIAVGGVSYGAGISLLASAADPRIKASLIFSGWADLFKALNWQNTPALQWGKLLVDTAKILGNEPPILRELLNDVLAHENMSFVESWASDRSAAKYLDKLNANKPAIYMAHQHGDNLFHSSSELDFFQQLNLPKHMDMSVGTHASAELLGFVGLDQGKTAANHIWGQARAWLDYYLKGIENDTPKLPLVQMQLGNDGILSDYLSFPSWPPTSDWSVQNYLVGPRDGPYGTLSTGATQNLDSNDTISFSSRGVQMTTGIVLVSEAISDILPITARLDKVKPDHGIVYLSGASTGSSQICGVPRLANLRVVPSEGQFQVVPFLYDVDLDTMKGRLITHGTYTVWSDAGASAGAAFNLPTIDFHTACWDMKAGHAVALGISMYDHLYQPASKTASITFDYSSLPTLQLPLMGDMLPSAVPASDEVVV
jgi:predicted acyl esterase